MPDVLPGGEHVHEPALGPEAYRLDVVGGRARITSSTARGADHARQTLRGLADAEGHVPDVSIVDAPALAHRGIIEGFYGEPWSDAERIAMFGFARRVKLNSYVYAPKDDPYHRERWREPYPDADLARLARLAASAAGSGISFVFALHPAGSMRFSDDAEHELLAAKSRQVATTGIRRFALLFDDVPAALVHAADAARFGAGAAGLGTAHAEAVVRFARAAPVGVPAPLVVPTDYAGVDLTDYRRAFVRDLPRDVLTWWTGRDIVVGEVTRADIDEAGAVFGDRLALWDNYPVNDFDRGRAFLGPLTGRTTHLAGSALRGAWANPMVECAPSAFALATFADWAWNPVGYDPARSARAALPLVAGADHERLAPLVRTLSSWPPSAPMDPELSALTEVALSGGRIEPLRARLAELAALGDMRGDTDLMRALRPWLDAAGAVGRAGLAAVRLLSGEPGVSVEAVTQALDAAAGHPAKVAVDVVRTLADALLSR
ncbi:beta-N-acetylglucosaminidase domain-containing protein [Microbacterium terrisoli]|uniref:beta-N-acetylglucosaminidase domain-containing protein n=1 Tax=Microbacterium terrisoli TaxID=3242192 RepID=UPI002804A862|nr:beta-N-acetylglucosaminidase domain-containing protein [Microbacterium protaetiae]